jgi:hypothetical protein
VYGYATDDIFYLEARSALHIPYTHVRRWKNPIANQ